MPPLKIVFDTNIYIMAAGMPGGYVDTWLNLAKPPARKFHLYASPTILAEVQEKLELKVKIERAMAVEYIEALKQIVTVINPTMTLHEVLNDPDDDRILECALESRADIIITADKDLLSMKQFRNTQIIHPSNLKYILQYLESDSQ